MASSDVTEDEFSTNGSFEMSLEEIYIISLNFFRENKDKAFHMTYPTRIRISALSHHIKYGSCESGAIPETGLLDVVGRDIGRQLVSVAKMTREDAMTEFIDSLKTVCPEFSGFLEAKEKQAESEAQIKKEEEEVRQQELIKAMKKEAQEKAMLEAICIENDRRVEQENRLRSALNRQTLPQFQEYASQQHPGDLKAQERLIVQLQHHHFHQYMLAVYERREGPQRHESGCSIDLVSTEHNGVDDAEAQAGPPEKETEVVVNGDVSCGASVQGYTQEMVEMWCQSSIDDFKASFKDDRDSVMKIGSGEVVTIKVAGSPEGEYLAWQFATDEHDIGFGLSVAGAGGEGVPMELLPVLRRDSHKQVYCGRLRLQGDRSDRLCFLLRFDNSYSLWRQKWLYYRVCYSTS